jgi:hypothetical protein
MIYRPPRIWLWLGFVVALAFALPALYNMLMSLLPVVIIFTVLVGIVSLLYGRRRRW